jgi:hypothetical protein
LPHDDVGGCFAQPFGHAHDLLAVQAGYLFGPGSILVLQLDVPPLDEAVRVFFCEGFLLNSCTFLKAVLAVLEVANELLVPEAGNEDLMGDGGSKGAIGSGHYGKPLVGLCRGRVEFRVHYDHGRLVQDVPKALDGSRDHAVAAQGVCAPDEHIF